MINFDYLLLSDTKLGHVTGRGWRLILVNAIGAVAILCTVVSTAIVQYVPNSFSGREKIDILVKNLQIKLICKKKVVFAINIIWIRI